MKYLGLIISLILIIAFYYGYQTHYLPMRKSVASLKGEIKMWENVVKGDKGLTGERNRFAVERFFTNDNLTPYAEVEMLRRFDIHYKGIELYISAPNALKRAKGVMKFMAEQRIEYQDLSFYVVIDSVERFEYKFVK
jgi:hypothetical protein